MSFRNRVGDWVYDVTEPIAKIINKTVEKSIRLYGFIICSIGFGVMLIGGWIFINQILGWLKYGTWVEKPVKIITNKIDSNLFYNVYNIDWMGVRKIVLWFFNQSSVVILIALGMVVCFFGYLVNEGIKDRDISNQ